MRSMYNVFFISRRLTYALLAVTLREHGAVQILLIFYQSVICATYILYYRPFETFELNAVEAFNEITILVCSYHLILFTGFNPNNKLQIKAGYSMIGVTVLNIFVNTTIMFVKTIGKVKRMIGTYRRKVTFYLQLIKNKFR